MARETAKTSSSSKAALAVYEQYRGGKHTVVSVGTAATALPATNLSNRKGAVIQNLHASNVLYIGSSIPEVLGGTLTSDYWRKVQTIDGDYKVVKWTASSGGTNEYYATNPAGGDPGLTEPLTVYGVLADGGAETLLTNGSVASLADHAWDWGDGDSLGFSTVYFADATGDPDTEAWFVLIGYTWHPDSSSSYGHRLGPYDAIAINLDGSCRIFGEASGSSTNVSVWEYR